MKFFFTILFFIPIFCRADYSEEGYFLTGRLYGADGKPLQSKEVLLVTGKRYFCFFVTDKQGYYKVEVPYLVTCLSGVDRTKFDDQALQEAKYYNNDTIKLYCDDEFQIIKNLWSKYYLQDTSCHHKLFSFHLVGTNLTCLTEEMDIHLLKNFDTEHKQIYYKHKIDSVRVYLNSQCDIPDDSVQALVDLYNFEKQELHLNHLKKYDSLKSSDTLITLKKLSWQIERAIDYYISRYQLFNRDIQSTSNPQLGGLCTRHFIKSKEFSSKEYYLKNYLSEYNAHYVLMHDNGIITDVYHTDE